MISLIAAPHNLHNYDELNLAHRHWPFPTDDPGAYLATRVPRAARTSWRAAAKLLLHGEELGDRICGMMAGYVLWAGLVDTGPRAIQVIEQITGRQIGPDRARAGDRRLDLPVAAAAGHAIRCRTSSSCGACALSGICGALPEERDRAQPLEIDLDVVADLRRAGRSDELDRHGRLRRRCVDAVEGVVTTSRPHLLEHLAERIAEVVLADDRVEAVTVGGAQAAPAGAPAAGHLRRAHHPRPERRWERRRPT